MVNYKNTEVELIPNPAGIDLAISKIQASFVALPWLQKAFARVTPQTGKYPDEEGRDKRARNEFVYPEAYTKREPVNMMPNDNFQSYCFFVANDPTSFPEYDHTDTETKASQPVSIIFWGNLKKIDPSKEYNFSEELRMNVIDVLRKNSDFELNESFIGYDRIFAPFTITETFRQYLKPPFFGFRFDGTLHYNYSSLIC